MAFSSSQRTKIDHLLHNVFGHTKYRGRQREIIEAAVSGLDVLVIAPTGMGKSVCFQVPATAEAHGVTIVVSPLLALMKTQVASLRRLGVPVASLTSETPQSEREEIIRNLSTGYPSIRILYTTPEKMCSPQFLRLLKTVYGTRSLNRLVVDEAHCISEWGHDFRAEYRRLGEFREQFKTVPIMALTATATPAVQLDIIKSLKLPSDVFTVLHPFNRKNLYYEVRYGGSSESEDRMAEIRDYIQTLHRKRGRSSTGIIYCRNKATCDELSGFLRKNELRSKPYHRGVKSTTLDRTLEEWQLDHTDKDAVDVVRATVAFGMGIDKSDVRYIIHYDLPGSMESYYQETGRAGRDGLPSKCLLYYSREDACKIRNLVDGAHLRRAEAANAQKAPAPSQRANDSLMSLIAFAESTTTCRHIFIQTQQTICRYFGENIDDKVEKVVKEYCGSMCDVCKYPDKTRSRKTKLSSGLHGVVLSNERRIEKGVKTRLVGSGLTTGWAAIDNGNNTNFKSSQGATNSFGPSDSRCNQEPESGSSKRRDVDAPTSILRETSGAKKRKFVESLPPALVTKPFGSEKELLKPFKTPFKIKAPTLPIDALERAAEPHGANRCDVEDGVGALESSDRSWRQDLPSGEALVIQSDPSLERMESDVAIELEASFSEKIPVTARQRAGNSIRESLETALRSHTTKKTPATDRIFGGQSDFDDRNDILLRTAVELEFSALSMCSTTSGYESRVASLLMVIEKLSSNREEFWDEDNVGVDEELAEIRGVWAVIKRQSKGKGRRAVCYSELN